MSQVTYIFFIPLDQLPGIAATGVSERLWGCLWELAFRAGEWPAVPARPWILLLAIIGLAALAGGLIWRKRKAAMAFAEDLYSHWQATIPPYRRSLAQLAAELERARRYRHPLAVVVMDIDYERHKQGKRNLIRLSGNARLASQFFCALISSILRENLRGSDIVTYDATHDHYVILLPESTIAAAAQTMSRLREFVLERTKVSLRYGIAEFPADGLTFDDLVSLALARNQRTACETLPREDAATTSQGAQRMEPLVHS